MSHVTHDSWGLVILLSKFQLPSSYGLEVKVCCRYFHKGSLTEGSHPVKKICLCLDFFRTALTSPPCILERFEELF